MPQHSDTPELRTDFLDTFMWTTDVDVHEVTMVDILDLFDMELGAAKVRYGQHFNADAQWADSEEWLSERGYNIGEE